MAQGQLTYLQLCNRVLQRLGKAQVSSSAFETVLPDSWTGIVKDFINDAQREVWKEHDWSTLQVTGSITTSARTFDLSAGFDDFGREVSLVSVTNNRVLVPVMARSLDEDDPSLANAGGPTHYAINYPDLLFNLTPDEEEFRLRYFRRPVDLTTGTSVSTLPEFCDMALVWWAVWQLQASREDAQDGGEGAKSIFDSSLARAIGQDQRAMDQVHYMHPIEWGPRSNFPFPSSYPAVYP